jgi:cysteine desulfurase
VTAPPARVVDALGAFCPVPVRMLARALARVPPGATVELLADDPLVAVDVPAWCHAHGVALLEMAGLPDGSWRALVRAPEAQGRAGPPDA